MHRRFWPRSFARFLFRSRVSSGVVPTRSCQNTPPVGWLPSLARRRQRKNRRNDLATRSPRDRSVRSVRSVRLTLPGEGFPTNSASPPRPSTLGPEPWTLDARPSALAASSCAPARPDHPFSLTLLLRRLQLPPVFQENPKWRTTPCCW